MSNFNEEMSDVRVVNLTKINWTPVLGIAAVIGIAMSLLCGCATDGGIEYPPAPPGVTQ